MDLRIVNEGEIYILDQVQADTSIAAHLYVDTISLVGDETLATFHEPSFIGYSAIPVSWSVPSTVSGVAISTGTADGFRATDLSGLPETVKGFYISGSSNTICIGAANFDSDVVVDDTSTSINIEFTLSLGDTADICGDGGGGGGDDCGSGFSCGDGGGTMPGGGSLTPLSIETNSLFSSASLTQSSQHYYGSISDPGCVGSDMNFCLQFDGETYTLTVSNDGGLILAVYTTTSWTGSSSAENVMDKTCDTATCEFPATLTIQYPGP